MRELIEDQWPELVQKLPPKRAAELIILIARETNRRATVRRPDPPWLKGPAGRDLSRRTGNIGASRPTDPCQRALASLNLKINPVGISLSVPTRRVGKRRAGTCCQRFCGATLTAPQSHCLTADHVICGCVLPRRPGNRKIWNGKPTLRTVKRNRVPNPPFRLGRGSRFGEYHCG
jgi:hypothetical protein